MRVAGGEARETPMPETRVDKREFLKGALAALLGAGAVATVGCSRSPQPKSRDLLPVLKDRPLPPAGAATDDHILRMTTELERALAKPLAERRWGMVIDLRKCVGCQACTINCAVENGLPPGVVYRPVLEEEIGTYPNVARRFIPRPCMQCEDPPCTPVCPVNATYLRPDGIVEIDYDQCIGCRYCLTACPYSARTSDFGDFFTTGVGLEPGELQPYERRDTFEYHEARNRSRHESPIGNARKCTFCVHRIENGMLPSCVTTCIGHATYFGDLNDSASLVAELAASPNVMRLKEELGTHPKVFYLL
jgi:molybdopterin-containing oxidoreductase family iron-sulfur binding subunit